MAQPQTQAKNASTTDTRRTTNMPATQARSMQPSGPMAWAAGGPFGLMRRLSDDMDQLFGELAGGIGAGSRGNLAAAAPVVLTTPVAWIPALDIFERDGQLVVQADLPGVAADNVTVEVEDGLLTVSGERREEREFDEDGIRRLERRYGKFSRSIALPEGAKADEIQASFRDGVLEITMPMAEPESNRRTINIQSGAPGSSGSGNASASAGAKGDTTRSAGTGSASSQSTTSGA